MKKVLLRNIIIYSLTTLLIFSITGWAQEKEDFAKPWEKRLNNFQPPIKIMDAIDLKSGMVIGDIGAGKGRFVVWFADRVGEKGKVYANDIVKNYLRFIDQRCKQLGFSNVITCLGTVVEPNIPDNVLDIAFMINVYHHLEKPVELLKNLIPTLKPVGTLVIIEPDPDKSGWPKHSTPQNELVRKAGEAGYELEKIETFLPKDNIYFFKVKQLKN